MDIFYIKTRKNLSSHRNCIYRLHYTVCMSTHKKHRLFNKHNGKLSCHDYFLPPTGPFYHYFINGTFRNLKPNFHLFFKCSLSAMARIVCGLK